MNQKKIRVVFWGTPLFAVPSLKSLASDPRIECVATVTQPDLPSGRLKKIVRNPVAKTSDELGIPVLQPHKISEESFLNTLQKLNPDLFIVAAYGAILPKTILELPKYKTVNIHPSLLPKYRGPSPIQSALLNGDPVTGVSIVILDEKMDHGPILSQESFSLASQETRETLTQKLAELSAVLITKTILSYVDGKKLPAPQDDSQATFCTMIKKSDGFFDPALENIVSLTRKMRAYLPWPGVFFTWNTLSLKIHEAKEDTTNLKNNKGLHAEQGKLLLDCKDGVLEILKIQPAGKKIMNPQEFINGYLKKS